jgi:hypothetical protein
VNVRSFYGVDGMKAKDIHTDDHGNPKQHPYGKHGEHVHDYEWDDDGRLKNKATREITDEEPGRERRYAMTQAEMKQIIQDCCNDVLFTYNQKSSGFTSDVKNYVTTFHAWHGTETKDYSSVNDLMSDPFFGGKSINELIGEVEFVFT